MLKHKRRIEDTSIAAQDTVMTEHNEFSGAKKTLVLDGCLKRIGDISSGHTTLRAGKTIALFNNSGSVEWYVIGMVTADVTPLTPGPTNGIPVPPFAYFYVSLGPNRSIKTSSADLLAFELQDDTFVAEYKTT